MLYLLDKTKTPMGGRMLKDWVSRPLMNVSAIEKRQMGVQTLLDSFLRMNVQTALKYISDLEKLSSKLAQNNISPRDVHKLASSVISIPDVLDPISDKSPFNNNLPENIPLDEANVVLLALVDNPPIQLKDGGVFRTGYNKELDEIVEIANQFKTSNSKYGDTTSYRNRNLFFKNKKTIRYSDIL